MRHRRSSMRRPRHRSSMRHRCRLSMRRHHRLSMRRHRRRSFVRRQRRSTRPCAEIPDDRHAPSRHQGVRPALKAHWAATSRGFQPSATRSANGRSLRFAAGRREPDDASPFAINPAHPGRVTPLSALLTPRRPLPRCQGSEPCSRASCGLTGAVQRADSWSADRSKTAWCDGWNGFRKRQDQDQFPRPGIHNPSILSGAQMRGRMNAAWEEKVIRRET